MTCWQFETLHFSMCQILCRVSYAVCDYEWDWDQVSGFNHRRLCACMNVWIMCVCMLLPVINVGKAAYFTEGLYKMFWVHSVYCWLCVQEILALMLCVSFHFGCSFFSRLVFFNCPTCNNEKRIFYWHKELKAYALRTWTCQILSNCVEWEGGVGWVVYNCRVRVIHTYVFIMFCWLCIHFKLRQALTLLFSVFILRFYKGKILFKQMRTRLIKMKVLASKCVLLSVKWIQAW